MSNETIKDPFLGFTYDGIHSGDLNIVRINTGSRFEENLLPTIVDKVLEIPGRDGKILQGTQFGPQNKKIDFAFDNMHEADINALKALFSKKKIGKLVYDERPERVWYAKPTGTNIFKFIPFEGPTKKREDDVYKGEGTINFICYDPFAHETRTIEASGNQELSFSGTNNGLSDVGFQLLLNSPPVGGWIEVYQGYGESGEELKLRYEFSEAALDPQISINSRIGLTEGIDQIKTGNIYDQYIVSGNYFQIPIGGFNFKVRANYNLTKGTLKFDELYL